MSNNKYMCLVLKYIYPIEYWNRIAGTNTYNRNLLSVRATLSSTVAVTTYGYFVPSINNRNTGSWHSDVLVFNTVFK